MVFGNIYEEVEPMEDTAVIETEQVEVVGEPTRALTLEEKVDIIGGQLNWLCENLTALFGLVNSMGQSGGGIRGLMKVMSAMKDGETNGGS